MAKKKTNSEKFNRDQLKFLDRVPKSYVPPAYMTHPTETQGLVVKQRFIEQWIIRGWVLTSQIAWRKFGHTRLADVIWRMRKRGFVIRTIMVKGIDRFGNKVSYAEYKINKARSKDAIRRYNKLHKVKKSKS